MPADDPTSDAATDPAADPAGDGPERVVCSAKGCRSDARHVLVWNNPRLHVPGREKTWAACDDHRDHLSEFLAVRDFLRRVEPLEQ